MTLLSYSIILLNVKFFIRSMTLKILLEFNLKIYDRDIEMYLTIFPWSIIIKIIIIAYIL